MKLLLKSVDDDDRLAPLRALLDPAWAVRVADPADPPAFASALAEAEAIISMNWPAAPPPAPRLRLLQLPGAGTDDIHFPSVPPTATVCNAFEHEIGIAEYVLAAMLEWTIGLRRLDAEFRQGRWWGSWLCGPRHGDLYGRTLGILGYGHIGRETARRASAFGVRVIAASRTPGAGDGWVEAVRGMDQLHAVLSESDFVLMALPLADDTRGLMDQAAFAAMRPGGVLINVGRGATVDEAALYEACRSRRIGGAVIDTWYRYPPQGGGTIPELRPSRFPFHELDNVIMTPHASAWSEALAHRRCRAMADNLNRLARGEPLVNVVRAPLAPVAEGAAR
jgi:phosphoglycerate dehydrogenase-like enzyme